MIWLCLFLICVVYTSFAEYILHRWIMHKPWPWRTKHYVEHHVLHHGRRELHHNISMSPLMANMLILPVTVGAACINLWFALLPIIFALVYAGTWTMMHNCHHDLKYAWIKKLPFYGWFRKHHLIHHDIPNRNYGTIFIWTDYLFGTKRR